ncbi:MFS transporter [Peribacillus frigoritolerans]|nr:MFS transporter [Peribacillus frigoritolerans]
MVIDHWKPLLICIGIVLFYNTMAYMVLTYMPAYLTQELGYGETKGLILMIIVMIIMMPIILAMGHLSDRIGRNRIIKGALIGVILLSLPAFMMIGNGNNYIVFCGLLLLQ